MNRIALILICTIISLGSLASECASRQENLNYSELDWYTGSIYTVNSSVQSVRGVLCIGFSNKRQIQRVHYFDDLGTIILKDAKELYSNDVIFFSKSMLPSFVRSISRSADPLSISLLKVSSLKSTFKLKFVENMMKGFSRTRIREVLISSDFSGDRPIFRFRGVEFDEFNLFVSNGMKITRISTYFQNKKVQSLKAYKFKLTTRKSI